MKMAETEVSGRTYRFMMRYVIEEMLRVHANMGNQTDEHRLNV